MLGRIAEQLAPELQRILAGGMRHLVHEAFEIDGVLIVVHAAPESRRQRWIAHRVVDHEIRNRIAEPPLGATRIEALEGDRIAAVLQAVGIHRRQDRLARDPHLERGHVAVGIERAGQLAHRDRVVPAVQHVLLARPDQLDRRVVTTLAGSCAAGSVPLSFLAVMA